MTIDLNRGARLKDSTTTASGDVTVERCVDDGAIVDGHDVDVQP
ncbi:hypothetical protein ACIQMV_39140 [Streptomyces sp. NPDC091412]